MAQKHIIPNIQLDILGYTTFYDIFTDKHGFPSFKTVTCSDVTDESKWDLCIKVVYPNDNQTDFMLLEDGHGWDTYKGVMKEERDVPVVFNWKDVEDGEQNATVVILYFSK